MISVLLRELGCDLEPGAIRNGRPDFAAVGGDDGLGNGKTDSMATGLGITGGLVTVCGPTKGDTSVLDYDTSGIISGGTFLGVGSSSMAQTFSGGEQGVISVNAGNCSAGTKITLTDSSGKLLLTVTPELDFALVILSSPEIQKGESYVLDIGGNTVTYIPK